MLILCAVTNASHAEGWCELTPGWSLITHGTLVDQTFKAN
jgi:hypothetical protein